MLNGSTKRKINSARDILVGKIPMPTTQVEQITLALIYKFMADMDKRSKALGDTSGFFGNGYEKYSWDKLMDKSLSARDRVKLYGEGLEKMSTNPHIPQLFRNIFKNAFLPFNDPETLKLFLDQIDQFDYEHSEELGNAFEYLLSSMSSQGDAGQFRTPRHIIDFIVKVVDPKKTDRVLDPACGTAGFLISAYKHLVKNGLKNEELKNVSQNFVGYDISHDMVRLSLVNLYLHHFPDPHIYEYDTLTSEDRWDDDFDVILANPPFMTPKGGIKPHNRFSIPSKRAEVLFTDYIMEHLSVNGKAGVIVPEGIIFQSQNAYKNLRKMMIDDDYLWAVVSLPSGVFNPYSGVKTSILLFDKTLAKKTNKILFVKVESDGYGLGAQRRKIKKDDLPQALEVLQSYKQAIIDGKDFETQDDNFSHLAEKAKIRESGDWNLSGERYRENTKIQSLSYRVAELGEIFSIIRNGKNVKQDDLKGKYKVTRIKTIANRKVNLKETKYSDDRVHDSYFLQNGDILFSHINSYKHLAKTALVHDLSQKVIHGTNLILLRPEQEIVIPEFVSYLFKSDVFISEAKRYAQKAVNQASIKVTDIKKLKIPLPPLSAQQEIVKELDRYQKIIDGAKQVVDNYQPEFEINEDWKWVEIRNLCDIKGGHAFKSQDFASKGIQLIKMGNVKNDFFDYKNKPTYLPLDFVEKYSKFILKNGDILISMTGTVGKDDYGNVCKVNKKRYFILNQRVGKITPNEKEVNPNYFYICCINDWFKKQVVRNSSGGVRQANISASGIGKITIPLPSRKIQEQIVSNIQEEQEIIELNQILIGKFEKKIKNKINKIWN